MPVYRSEGLLLSYRDAGVGPVVVLIHGWGANGREWDVAGWTSVLAPGRRLLIPDLRGHGASSKPHEAEAYRMKALARDMLALLEAAGADQADLLGYSMGGGIAIWTAVLAPNRVRSLISGGVVGSDAAEVVAAMGRELRGQGALSERAARYRDYAATMGEHDLQALGACLEAGLSPPPCPELAIFGGEALMVAGDRDWRREATEHMAGCLPGGRFLLLDGADHMAAFADPRFKRAAVEFLAEVSPLAG